MTKEQFMQIAEEVGIVSSDWKEDLWRAHLISKDGLVFLPEDERDLVFVALKAALQAARNTLFRGYVSILNFREGQSREAMTPGEKHFWDCMVDRKVTGEINSKEWVRIGPEARKRWEVLASKAYSDEQRETEKRATVRGSKEPLRGDDAESEQQGEGSETSKNTLENIPRGF